MTLIACELDTTHPGTADLHNGSPGLLAACVRRRHIAASVSYVPSLPSLPPSLPLSFIRQSVCCSPMHEKFTSFAALGRCIVVSTWRQLTDFHSTGVSRRFNIDSTSTTHLPNNTARRQLLASGRVAGRDRQTFYRHQSARNSRIEMALRERIVDFHLSLLHRRLPAHPLQPFRRHWFDTVATDRWWRRPTCLSVSMLLLQPIYKL